MKRSCGVLLLLVISVMPALAKSEPPITLLWPPEKPALKLTFDKFREQSHYDGQNSYISDVTLTNLTDKQIPRALFTVYLFDKNKVRIGEGQLQVANLEGGQTARMQFQFLSVGVPASLNLSAKKDMLSAKTIPLRILSVPTGAKLRVDGQDSGVTPIMIRVTVGVHQLDLTKEGYASGSTPLEVTADELPGGSITVELGGLSRDTVELRDGSNVLGDVVSMSMTEVMVRVNGQDKKYDRNQVNKIILVERVTTQQPVVMQPVPAKAN